MLDDEAEAPCARCRRATPVESLRLWTTRERVRTLTRRPGPDPGSIEPAATEPAATEPAATDPSATHGEEAGALLTRAPPAAFRHDTVTRADAVCAPCHARLLRGAALDGPERLKVWLTLGVFLLVAAMLTWGVPAIMPNLLAAFWRNGAGGR